MANDKLKTKLDIVLGDDINVPEMEIDRDRHRALARNYNSEVASVAAEAVASPEELALRRLSVTRLRTLAQHHNEMDMNLTTVLASVRLFEASVTGIYNSSDSLFSQVESVQSQLGGVTYSATTQTYTLPAGLYLAVNQLINMNTSVEAALIEKLKSETDGYNWELIESWMQENPQYLSQAQLSALVTIFIGMECVLDVERFINAGYSVVEIKDGRATRTEYVRTGVFEIVSESVLKNIERQIREMESSSTPFSTSPERLLYIKYYELQNDTNRRAMDGFLTPIKDAGLYDDILEIKFISYQSPEPYQELLFKYLEDIKIVDNKGERAQHYKTEERAIYVNFSNLSGNGYRTFFHEIGHAIDYAMGGHEKYESNELLKTLEGEVTGHIESVIAKHTTNELEQKSVLNALKFDGERSDLTTPEQQAIYDRVVRDYLKIFDISDSRNLRNSTASMIFGGFTELAIRTDPISGDTVGRGHGIYHPFALDDDGNPRRMWYDPEKGPTNAQNREFFADIFSTNVTQDTDRINANNNFFGATIAKMEDMIEQDLKT